MKLDRDDQINAGAPCLHCAILEVMNHWFVEHGPRENGEVIIDATIAIGTLQECAAEFIEQTQDRSARRRAQRFAHDAIDAAVKALKTGETVPVDIVPEH